MKKIKTNNRKALKQNSVPEDNALKLIPTSLICESIMFLVEELRRRGQPIYDWDDKTKSLQAIRIYDKIYFFAVKEETNEKG